MDIRGVEITNQLRSAIRAKLLELGVRYDDELPDYILVMVVNKKSRSQMNEDLNLFLEDNTEPFVNWLHDQVLKKLQKVTVAKKKTNKDAISTAIVKQEEEDKKKPKIEDEPPMKSDTPKGEPTKVERDKEFDELVGDLAMLNEDDGKSNVKESQVDDKEKSQNAEIALHDIGSSSNDSSPEYPERKNLYSSVSIPKSSSIDKTASNEAEKVNDTSSSSLKRMSNDNSEEETAPSAKRSKFSNDSDSEDDDNRVKSSVNKPKLLSVVSVKTRVGGEGSPPASKQESQTKSKSDTKNEISSQRSSLNRSKSIDRKKPRTEDLRNESRRDNRHPIRNSNSEKSSRLEETRDKERLGGRSGTIKSRLGTNNSNKQDVPSLKSTNSTKVSKPRISNVRSRLGVRTKQQDRELLRTSSKLSKISQRHFQDEDDVESEITTSTLKSHIIAVQKSKKRKQATLDALIKPKKLMQEVIEEDEDQDDKVPSKIIVTPRPLQPLKPVQKRATQSLLLKAVAEANQSVVMQKKVDPCLKEQTKPTNKIKITRDPWEGKILSVSLNGKKRNVMEKIQVELNNPDKSKSKKSLSSKKSQIVTDEHMDVVKSLFKRSDDKQKFLVTLNGYNNNVLKEKNSDEEERVNVEVLEVEDDDDEISLVNNQYDAYEDEVQIIENDDYNNDHPLGHNQEMRQEPVAAYTKTYTDTYTDRYTDTYKDQYADKYTDKQVQQYAEKQIEQYADKQADKYADTYKDKYTDKYTDKQVDQYTDKYTDKPAAQYSDKPAAQYTDKYPDKPAAQYTDKYPDKSAAQYTDKYPDKPAAQYTNKYPNKPAAPYADKYLHQSCAPYSEHKNDHNMIDNREHLRVEQISGKNHRKPSPIVYSRSRSDSPASKPTVASTITSVLKIDKRPLISSIITTVADKSSEKCRYWPTCTLGVKCAYLHPEVLCSSFPACKFGEKCAYKHPKCKFGSACTKLGCKFSHPPVKCKYHPYCMKPGCQFSHPKTSSSSKLTHALTPDISTVRAKFTWKKKE